MNDAIHFDIRDGIATFRLAGPHHFSAAVDAVNSAIQHACSQGHERLLIDGSDLAGFDPPGIADRHAMVRRWAEAAQGRLRVALVTRPEFIDPERFGVVAAANFGLATNVFATEAEALVWLRSGTV